MASPCRAQPLDEGFAFLVAAQQEDGSWTSGEVRALQATTEALRALQAADREPGPRSAAADFLSIEPVADHGDRSRRLGVLAAEGRDVAASREQLLAGTASEGGWGLTPAFWPDPLDTALALQALAGALAPEDESLQRGLTFLRASQREDGGFPCAAFGDADSQIFCTSHALLALVQVRSTTFVEPEIDAAVGFLRDRLHPDGSFGPAGPDEVVHTALASLALAAVPAFGSEVAAVTSFLEGRQQPDGSWQADPYPTALALRALVALHAVHFCGDGVINNPREACDGLDGAGQTCELLGLGSGTVACSPQCTFDTSGCSEPPSCGDDLRNQPFEVCDGTDLAAESCESLGFPPGALSCAADCLSFDTDDCTGGTCGDGVVNQPGELCDFNDLNGQTCESLGLGSGLLRCAPDCNLDSSLCDAVGFDVDNKGREFLVGFMPNNGYYANAILQLTSDVPTEVTVQHPVVSPTFVVTVAVQPGKITGVNLPKSAHYDWWRGQVLNNAVRASAPDEFAAYLVNRQSYTTDSALALPVDALGTSYILTTFVKRYRSQFLVVAPFDDTTVTITPTATLLLWDTTAPPGVPFQITLDRGEGFRGEAPYSGSDLTGTLVSSDRPLAVFNGNECANVPADVTFCDHLFETAHPVRSWGTSALVTHLPDRPAGSLYRVVASQDGTVVTLDGDSQAILDRGEFLETGPLPGNHVFAANHPIFVTQLMTGSSSPGASLGDPSMANMIPPEQYVEEYTFATVYVGPSYYSRHFVTVTAPDSSLGAVLLDGSPIDPGAFSPVPGSGFSTAVLPIAAGSHTTSSPEPHGITVEGFYFRNSYLHPGGARLEFIFCGDGKVNLDDEECDGTDFQGADCATFGFSAGFLQCSADCRIDTSQCSDLALQDEDGDGFRASQDCDDLDAEVNPGMAEFLGNGVDDDCNPGTPDEIPETALSCSLVSAQIAYLATEDVTLDGAVENGDASFSLTGLSTLLVVRNSSGTGIFEEARPLAPLPPGARLQQSFAFTAFGHPPEDYVAELTVVAAGEPMASCSTAFVVESSAGTGAGLTGTLTLDPEQVDAGESSDATYTLENLGNAALIDLAVRVLLLDPDTGETVGELFDSTSLSPGGSFDATQPFSSVGLASNKTFLAVLLATPSGTEAELTLGSATLTVENAPPDCSGASAALSVLWPPNHKLVEIEIGGVTDPDGDPVTLTVAGVLQDERTDDLGSGDTCPDATGVGTPRASLRAERSARQDGRVYHVFFLAEDGRGGTCEGKVTVCVPHDRQGACVDQGALHDSTICR